MAYYFGGFQLDAGVNGCWVMEKPEDFLDIKQALFKIARREGQKSTGQTVDARQIALKLKVIGTTRTDLENKLDALYSALSNTQQQLNLHSNDGRYYIADAVAARAQFVPGSVVAVEVPVTFLCQQPFAYAAAASTTGNLTANFGNLVSTGVYSVSGGLSIVGGGNVYSYPLITLTNIMVGTCTLTSALASGTAYTTLHVTSLPWTIPAGGVVYVGYGSGNVQAWTCPSGASSGATSITVTSQNANAAYAIGATVELAVTRVKMDQELDSQLIDIPNITFGPGDVLVVTTDPTASGGYTVTINSGAPLPFTGIFPVMEPGTNPWNIYIYHPAESGLTFQCQYNFTWTPRWLS